MNILVFFGMVPLSIKRYRVQVNIIMEKSGQHFSGVVVRGEGEAGPLYGIPTANLKLSESPDIEIGIYAAVVDYDGKKYNASVCYGPEEDSKFEVHLFDFDADISGKQLSGEIVEKISEFVELYSEERLRQKILHDIEIIKEYFTK